MKNRAVFLDRDGTIARDVHYCRRVEDFELLPSVPEALKLLNENGFKVVIVTNQSGIARGYFTEETLAQIHKKMKEELAKCGARVDAIYYCPHHPNDGCDCRKPKTALFHRAAEDWDIDFPVSYVVGDMQIDIDAGKALGCKTVLVTNNLQSPIPNPQPQIDSSHYTANSLLQAAQWIIEDVKLSSRLNNRASVGRTTSNGEQFPIAKPVTTIIVPAYNEEQGLPIVLEKIFELVDGNYEVIVVDDCSTDRTPEVASQYPCQVRRHEVNQGKGEALKTAIKNAKGGNIVWIDADDTYPVELIPQMAEALETYDMVVCSRLYGRDNISRLNRIGNWLFRTMIRKIYGFKPFDPCTGLYGAKKIHLEAMNLTSKRFAVEPEISIKGSKMKLKQKEIPIEYRKRQGVSKLNAMKVGFEDLRTILSLILWHPKVQKELNDPTNSTN